MNAAISLAVDVINNVALRVLLRSDKIIQHYKPFHSNNCKSCCKLLYFSEEIRDWRSGKTRKTHAIEFTRVPYCEGKDDKFCTIIVYTQETGNSRNLRLILCHNTLKSNKKIILTRQLRLLGHVTTRVWQFSCEKQNERTNKKVSNELRQSHASVS